MSASPVVSWVDWGLTSDMLFCACPPCLAFPQALGLDTYLNSPVFSGDGGIDGGVTALAHIHQPQAVSGLVYA